MSEELKAKVKAIFPEDVEGIYISKNDYDRLYGDLTLENIELKEEIERLTKQNKALNEMYGLTKEEIKKTEISYYRQQELLEKLKEFKEIPELRKQVERLESMLKNDLIIYI